MRRLNFLRGQAGEVLVECRAPPMDARSTAAAVPFTLSHVVGDDDIDMLGHASNIAYVRWVQDVAMAHSGAAGFGMEEYARIGAVFVIRRHEVDYLRPVLLGEKLELRTWIESAVAAKCKRATEIARVTPGAPEVIVARAMTTWGFIEIATGRPTRIPDEVRRAFSWPTRAEERAAEAAASERFSAP
ncbi:MAG: hypothetical protein JWP97_6069 [Labilithrix sp.]|nr:hypothetical protein [Labilithrix sp.]